MCEVLGVTDGDIHVAHSPVSPPRPLAAANAS